MLMMAHHISTICCEAFTPECLACQACLTPEQWCADQGWTFGGCEEYEDTWMY